MNTVNKPNNTLPYLPHIIAQVLPEDWNKPFLFEEMLETFEGFMKQIDPTGLWTNKQTNKQMTERTNEEK